MPGYVASWWQSLQSGIVFLIVVGRVAVDPGDVVIGSLQPIAAAIGCIVI